MRRLRITRRLVARLRQEEGMLLVELLIALTVLTVAIGALITAYASTHASMRHVSIEGNALTIVDKQMERFKTLPLAAVALNAGTIPGSTDVYRTSPPSNVSSGSIASGQRTGGTYSATQTVTGPDGRTYRLDTYIFPITPTNGQPGAQVVVAARLVKGSTPGYIRAQATSAIDLASTQTLPS